MFLVFFELSLNLTDVHGATIKMTDYYTEIYGSGRKRSRRYVKQKLVRSRLRHTNNNVLDN